MSTGITLLSQTITESGNLLIGTPAQVDNQGVPAGIGLDVSRIELMVAQCLSGTVTGGGSLKVYFQHSVDGGTTWCDFIAYHTISSSTNLSQMGQWVRFAVDNAGASPPINTAGVFEIIDGSLTQGSVINGPIGDDWRLKWVVTSTFSAAITITARQIQRTR